MRAFWLLGVLAATASADIAHFFNDQGYESGAFGGYPRQSYISNLEFHGPVGNVLVQPHGGMSSTPLVTLGAVSGGEEKRAMLIDANTFSIAWAGPQASGKRVMSPKVHECKGQRLMAWFHGDFPVNNHSNGISVINENYDLLWDIRAIGHKKNIDLHEAYITDECTIVYTMHEKGDGNTSYTMPDGTVVGLYDSHFQEVDLATGELLFEWQASKAIPDAVETSLMLHKDFRQRYDWFHLNSIEKDRRGNYLISSRHCSTIFYISGIDGTVIWRLGGPNSDWKDMSGGRALDFHLQHHVRWVDETHTRITLFDNGAMEGNYHTFRNHSRGVVLELDHFTRQVRLQHAFEATDQLQSVRLGSVQVLDDTPDVETVMVGWGQEPAWTEFSTNGEVLSDVRFGPNQKDRDSFDNYRALKANWTGRPRWAPKIAPGPPPNYVFDPVANFHVQLEDTGTGAPLTNDTVYFSWNGATEIKEWVVLASNATAELSVWRDYLTTVPKTGFENYAFVGAGTKYVAALALDKNNAVLGSTPVLDMQHNAQLHNPAGTNGTVTAGLTKAWRTFDTIGRDNFSYLRRVYSLHPIAVTIAVVSSLFCLATLVVGALILLRRRTRSAQYGPVDSNECYADDDSNNDDSPPREKHPETDSMFSYSDDETQMGSPSAEEGKTEEDL